ncbi:MAG: hypothetical protein CO090_10260 [Acidobacteria bacterium CG_4_9_14_3_um_filter_49_7]|nr:MAG: hypothetical protein CO090_10260 [Acidobacteria bacterium CG_4_9_14_3_um_filter_49_7]
MILLQPALSEKKNHRRSVLFSVFCVQCSDRKRRGLTKNKLPPFFLYVYFLTGTKIEEAVKGDEWWVMG